MKISLKNIFSRKNRILLAELVRTDFKLRYENSFLGYVWSILNPLLLFAVLYLVFGVFLGLDRGVEHFPVYLLTGIVLWRFFTEATNNGLKAVVARSGLIRKINFPKYIIVISGTVSSLINLGINLAIVLLFMVLTGVPITWEALLAIPYIVELYIFALGIAFLLSAINVYLRDISYLWEVFIQAAFYATPIIYPISIIYEKSEWIAQALMILNPVAQAMHDVRYHLITHETLTVAAIASSGWMVFIPFALVAIAGIVGGLYFKAKSGGFAEHV